MGQTALGIETGRIARFGIVGVCATIVYIGASITAVDAFGFTPVWASILGQCTSMLVSYLGHSIYSFQVESDHRTFLWRFLVIAAVTFAMNGAVTWALTGVLGLSHFLSISVVTIAIPVVNYLCNRFWVFLPGLASPSKVRGS